MDKNLLLEQLAPTGGVSLPELALPVGRKEILKAHQTLLSYKAGKANLENRIIQDEQWYKLRHWQCMRKSGNREVEPASAWLFNAIANKHADAMDNFPAPYLLPREEGDRDEAKILSAIVPVILDQCGFEKTYAGCWDAKLKSGTGVYGIFWDAQSCAGLGEVVVRDVDVLNLFWEPGITDIQASRNLFHVELWDNEVLKDLYPDFVPQSRSSDVSHYIYDDSVDTSGKSCVVDWYYKRFRDGRDVLHYCKFVGDQVLFATENEADYLDSGWYSHGKYPFVFDPLFPLKGTPCGFGYIDVGKNAQEYIDRGNQAVLENLLANAGPRYFVRNDGSVNEEEYGDLSRKFVHVDGNLGQDSIAPIQGKALSSIYVQVINNKIDELKEVTGNRDIATGGTASGVTAASAIAAMQEAGSKLSRDHIKASYRVFRELCLQVVELIRQFYDLPRAFRIVGEDGSDVFLRYCNRNLLPQHQGDAMGVDLGWRTPLFDIEISAQKKSPYSRLSQNELALQFYNAGFFNPAMAQQAMACLEMMDFDRKDFVMQRIAQAGAMAMQQAITGKRVELPAEQKENALVSKARQRVANGATPQ